MGLSRETERTGEREREVERKMVERWYIICVSTYRYMLSKKIYFKELAHTIMRAGKSEMHEGRQKPRN